MQVSIIGPNLLDQSKGGIHVHKFGCADTKKAEYRLHRSDVMNPVEVDFVADVVEYVYPHYDFDYDRKNLEEVAAYMSDIYFFPCTSGLTPLWGGREVEPVAAPVSRRHAPKSRKF